MKPMQFVWAAAFAGVVWYVAEYQSTSWAIAIVAYAVAANGFSMEAKFGSVDRAIEKVWDRIHPPLFGSDD